MFVGREEELENLKALATKNKPTLAVVKGRRRVGKSSLIAKFASQNTKGRFWSFAGLAPQEGISAQDQRDHFARKLALMLRIPPLTFQDWSDALQHLSTHLKAGDIILFDEISWMGHKDNEFISKLKAWWDEQNIPVILFFCGSVSTWIEDNILNSTAFFGRVNLTITLRPLNITESCTMLRAIGFQGSDYDKFKLLTIMGGIPWYLEQIVKGKTADAIIKSLCFSRDGILVLEFDRIFHDLFNGKGAVYKKILDALKEGPKTLSAVREITKFPRSGTLSKLMENLITAGFVSKQALWSLKTHKKLKQSIYRICDPYTRFYLKMIEPARGRIDQGSLEGLPLSQLQGIDAHISLQVEQLLLQNRASLIKSMDIAACDIVADGTYRQSNTASRRGCQIDYLVQTSTKNLFVCEFKFKRREIGTEIIEEMQEKVDALKVPRGFAVVPVLFHIGGVSAQVETKGYFYRIIDIADLLGA